MLLKHRIPGPEYFAEKVSFSTNYLSDLLKNETDKTTNDHIIELAKTELIASKNTVNELACNLGFNYPHYFSRMFQKKAGESPRVYKSQLLN